MHRATLLMRAGPVLPDYVLTRTAPPLHHAFAKHTGEITPLIIDINYAYPGGSARAIQRLRASIPIEQIAPHYAVASCTPQQLLPLMEEEPSPIHRVWPNFSLQPLITITSSETTNPTPLARGDETVWAVLDTGILGTHPHFAMHNNLALPTGLTHMSFTGNDPLTDTYDHGTHTAGTIAGATKTHSGIAPEATVLSLQVMDENGRADTSAVIAALSYIVRLNERAGTRIIHGANISLGYDFSPDWFAAGQTPICKAVDRLSETGVLVVIAAGNSGTYSGGIADPGNATTALTVGSAHSRTPHKHGVSFFSATGPTRDGRAKPDLVAPGEQIVSATANGYAPRSGTSVAAAYASGVAAALSQYVHEPRDLKNVLMRTAQSLHRDPYYQGAGYIDGNVAKRSVAQP